MNTTPSRPSWKVPGALVLVAALTLAAPLAAHAAPTPSHGPTTGGTMVSDALPGVRFTSVAEANDFSVAVASDGHLYAWGDNRGGQLGRGTKSGVEPVGPVHTPTGVTFTEVHTGHAGTWATGSDGNTYAWGWNEYGQLGDGTTIDRATPVVVAMPAGVTLTKLSAGGAHTVALGSDGNAYAWGANPLGQLGDGTTISRSTPAPVLNPTGVTYTDVSAGEVHSAAIGSDGLAYAWGGNRNGQLGDGELIVGVTRPTPGPVELPAGLTVDSISSGIGSSIVHASDGNYYAWGDNEFGQLSDGSNVDRPIPVRVQTPPGVTVTQMRMGGYHTAMLGSDGTAWAWGSNMAGELGDGVDSASSPVPVPILLPTGIVLTELALSSDKTGAIGSDGNVYIWGAGLVGPPRLVPGGATTVTSVTFGGTPGTNLAYDGARWSVDSPAGACGPVVVTVAYTQLGQDYSFFRPNGFTYGTAASIVSQPASATVTAGDAFSTTIDVEGDTAPSIQWQVLADETWSDLADETEPTLSTTPAETTSYRAVVTNCLGSVTSDIAIATVSAHTVPPATIIPTTGGINSAIPPAPHPAALAKTGSDMVPIIPIGLALLAFGAVTITVARRRAQSRTR